MVLRGLARRCARCGHGGLFHRWFTMRERCGTCGYRFEREEGFFLGAYVVNFVVTQLALAAFMVVSLSLTLPDPPTGLLVAGGLAVTVVVPLVFYPFSRTLWAAVDLTMQPLGDREIAEASAALGGGGDPAATPR